MQQPLSSSKQVLQIVAVQLRVWVADSNDVVCRPWYIFCLELYPRGQVINQARHSIVSEKPQPKHFLSFLLRHISAPPTDEPRKRPTHVAFVDQNMTNLLKPVLKRLKIAVDTLTMADGVQEYIKKFSDKLVSMDRATRGDAAERPGILSVPTITPEMMTDMTNAAVATYANAPWNRIPEHVALEVRLPSKGTDKYRKKYYLTVLGSDRKGVTGLVLTPTLGTLRMKYRRAMLSRTAATDSDDEESPVDGNIVTREDDLLLCAACGRRVGQKPQADGAVYVFRCAGCRKALYCGEECQKYDWRKRHRHECERARTDANFQFKREEWAWIKREVAMLFLDPTAIPFDDLENYDQYSWKYVDFASPPLYPLAFATIQGKNAFGNANNKVDRPTANELNAITLIARALAECASPPPQEGILHFASGVSVSFGENLAESIRS